MRALRTDRLLAYLLHCILSPAMQFLGLFDTDSFLIMLYLGHRHPFSIPNRTATGTQIPVTQKKEDNSHGCLN